MLPNALLTFKRKQILLHHINQKITALLSENPLLNANEKKSQRMDHCPPI